MSENSVAVEYWNRGIEAGRRRERKTLRDFVRRELKRFERKGVPYGCLSADHQTGRTDQLHDVLTWVNRRKTRRSAAT